MPRATKKMPVELSNIEKEFIDNIFKLAFELRGWRPIQLGREFGFSDGWASNMKNYKRGREALSINLLYASLILFINFFAWPELKKLLECAE